MEVGEVRPAENSDFERLLEMASQDSSNSDWELAVRKSHCSIYTRTNDSCNFKMIKLTADVPNVAASTFYNALHDAKYRSVWDKSMVESREICVIDPENDIGYYQVKTPSPLRNRDFVTQRSWRAENGRYMIMNHSVYHKSEPPRKNIIRGTSYYTGYVMESAGKTSSRFTYISQSNPGGNIPVWLVNKLVTVVAPKVVKKMLKACQEYEVWKKKNEPDHMPWLWPDQMSASIIDWDDVVTAGQEVASICSEELSGLQTSDVTDDIIRDTAEND